MQERKFCLRKSPLLRIDAENSNMCGNDMGTSGSNISKTETKMERDIDQRKKGSCLD